VKKSESAIRIGVIGLGMAGGAMIPAIEAHHGFTLAGAADLNPELRARFSRDHACDINANATELISRDDIDAVYIATPHQLHREHVVLAAENGKHAIVEKPMALSLDSDELHGWIGESGQPKSANHGSTHRALAAMQTSGDEARARSQRYGYGGDRKWGPQPGQRWHQPHFGTLIVSCERADLRQSADGILMYSANGVGEIEVPSTNHRPGRSDVLDELYGAVAKGILPIHDGRFARGTLEVCLAIQESSRRRSEVALPVPQQPKSPIKSRRRAAWA
jgi:predicted dehydrogenase